MYKQLLVIIFACLFVQRQVCAQYFPVDTSLLNKAYINFVSNPKLPKSQMVFFKLYPSTWMEYNLYLHAKENMWDLCDKHSKAFERLYGVIPDSLYFDKLISLSVGGRWNADCVNFFQIFIHRVTKDKPKVMLDRLSKQTKGYQLRFWQFYWSSLPATYEYEEEHDGLRRILIAINPEATKIMDIGFEYAWKEYDFQDIHPTLDHDISNIR